MEEARCETCSACVWFWLIGWLAGLGLAWLGLAGWLGLACPALSDCLLAWFVGRFVGRLLGLLVGRLAAAFLVCLCLFSAASRVEPQSKPG